MPPRPRHRQCRHAISIHPKMHQGRSLGNSDLTDQDIHTDTGAKATASSTLTTVYWSKHLRSGTARPIGTTASLRDKSGAQRKYFDANLISPINATTDHPKDKPNRQLTGPRPTHIRPSSMHTPFHSSRRTGHDHHRVGHPPSHLAQNSPPICPRNASVQRHNAIHPCGNRMQAMRDMARVPCHKAGCSQLCNQWAHAP